MKRRYLVDNDQVEDAKIEQYKVNKKIKCSYQRFWRFTCRAHKQPRKKLTIILGLILLLSLTALLILYSSKQRESCKVNKINNYNEYINQHMLPIGTATDKDYYITRPNGRDDGGIVRVMFMIASTRMNWTLCYAVASAYFNNIPIVVIGYKTQDYNNIKKTSMYLTAVEQAGLNDSDVVLTLDSDIMFTGVDYIPFVDKFIKLSPANLNELDAKAIRTGEMMAPSIYGSEGYCWIPQTVAYYHNECSGNYSVYEEANNKYRSTLTGSVKPFFNYANNPLQFLNSGTSIHRVWAARKLFNAFHKFIEINKPLDNKEWWEDQSVLAKLYLELRLWEIEQDYFRKRTDELRTIHNEYGLYAGMMGLDLRNEFSSSLWTFDEEYNYELTTEMWYSTVFKTIHIKVKHDIKILEFVENLYSSSNTKKLFTERMLTRSYSNVHSVTIAPPLLSVVPRYMNGKDKPAERVYPWIAHYAGFYKEEREQEALSYMQWSLPMMFDKEEWKRGKQYAVSMPIELWTSNGEKLRLRYGDVCERELFNEMKWSGAEIASKEKEGIEEELRLDIKCSTKD